MDTRSQSALVGPREEINDMACYFGLDSENDCRGTPCASCTANDPESILGIIPEDEAREIIEEFLTAEGWEAGYGLEFQQAGDVGNGI